MGDKITLTRPNGSTIDATPEQADRLAVLGYKPVTPEQNQARLATEARTDYYTSGGQQATAGLEGLASGLSLGASDYLFGDEDSRARAAYNPGTRLGAETVGAILPMLLTDGASSGAAAADAARVGEEGSAVSRLSRFAPSNILAAGADTLAVGREGSLTRAVTKGAIEGGLFGGFQDADHSYLAGDPVTAEAILHGVGWGAVFGGALGFLGGGAETVGKKAAAAMEGESSALQDAQMAADSEAAFKSHKATHEYFSDLEARAKAHPEFVKEGALTSASGAEYTAFRGGVDDVAREAREATTAADGVVNDTLNSFIKSAGKDAGAISDEVKAARNSYANAMKAAKAGRSAEAQDFVEKYANSVDLVGQLVGVPPGAMSDPAKALGDLVRLKAVARELTGVPNTVNEFALMGPAKLERTAAALEAAKSLPFRSISGLTDSTANLAKALGISGETPDLIRSTWKAAKETFSAEGKPVPKFEAGPMPKTVQPKLATTEIAKDQALSDAREGKVGGDKPAFLDHALGYIVGGKAYAAARLSGFGHGASYATYRGVKEAISNAKMLSNVRTAAVGRIRQAAAEYLPGAGAAVRASVPTASAVATALSTNLAGQKVTYKSSDIQDMARDRVREFAQAAPTIKDSLFKSLEPLGVTQPILTPALHQAALTAFEAVTNLLPKDTGTISALQSTWKPSTLQAVVLSKQLSVFHDPQGEAVSMLRSNNIDPIKVQTLKEVAPNTWQDLRMGVLQRITDPKIAASMTYRDQVRLSTLLDIDIHTSTSPQQIASSQMIFAQRTKPLDANPRMGQGGGLPNPKDNVSNNPNSTAAQRDTER